MHAYIHTYIHICIHICIIYIYSGTLNTYLLSTPALGDPNDPKRLTPETKTPEKKRKLIWVVGVPLKGSFKGFKGDYEGYYKSLV